MLDTGRHSLCDGDIHLGISSVQLCLILLIQRAGTHNIDFFLVGLDTRTSDSALIKFDTPDSNAKEDHGSKNGLVVHAHFVFACGRIGISYKKVMNEQTNLCDVQCTHLMLEFLNDELICDAFIWLTVSVREIGAREELEQEVVYVCAAIVEVDAGLLE